MEAHKNKVSKYYSEVKNQIYTLKKNLKILGIL